MRKLVLLGTSLCAMALSISVSPASAQTNLWVSKSGNDANVCSQAFPCLTFQGAVNKGGVSKINCLNSGDYGPVIITASIILDCGTGNVGEINNNMGTAITINAASAA